MRTSADTLRDPPFYACATATVSRGHCTADVARPVILHNKNIGAWAARPRGPRACERSATHDRRV